MTRNESIALAVKLHKEFKEIEKLQDQISENEKTVSHLYELEPKRYYAVNYFTPYFGSSIIFLLVILIPAYCIVAVSNFIDKNNHNDELAYMPYAVAFVIAFIFALIHLIGGFVARHKSRYMNNLEIQRVLGEKRKIKRLQCEKEELMTSLNEVNSRLEENNILIPSDFRNSKKMADVKRMLLSGKAKSFDDAIQILRVD